MSNNLDFENYWLTKLSNNIALHTDIETADFILEGSESHSDATERLEIISWTRNAAIKMIDELGTDICAEIFISCACHMPPKNLMEAKEAYESSGELTSAHTILQRNFEAFLREGLGLNKEMISLVINNGWGAAGILEGNTILATKIPKSGYLKSFLEETNPKKRREVYCHCPRIRDAIRLDEDLPEVVCYCGAGFYQNIWETITGKQVSISITKSLHLGDDVCAFKLEITG